MRTKASATSRVIVYYAQVDFHNLIEKLKFNPLCHRCITCSNKVSFPDTYVM